MRKNEHICELCLGSAYAVFVSLCLFVCVWLCMMQLERRCMFGVIACSKIRFTTFYLDRSRCIARAEDNMYASHLVAYLVVWLHFLYALKQRDIWKTPTVHVTFNTCAWSHNEKSVCVKKTEKECAFICWCVVSNAQALCLLRWLMISHCSGSHTNSHSVVLFLQPPPYRRHATAFCTQQIQL